MKKENTLRAGFTLIEMLVVVLIIGILASIAVPWYQKAMERSRASEGIMVLKSVAAAISSYQLSTGSFPQTFDELSVDVSWTGNEKWSTIAGVKDTRSNGDWSIQLYEFRDQKSLYLGKLKGKYRGVGFVMLGFGSESAYKGVIFCAERTSSGITFAGQDGEYCADIMDGTIREDTTATSFRVYDMP
ncbi:MAG: type II secretion system protein [Elusimicrobiaceae bacterium]|nr:type II secretion system protein [Elusimicrobiaceae bacterium]